MYLSLKTGRLFACLALLVFLPAVFAYIMGADDRHEVSEAQTHIPAVRQTGMIRIGDEEFVSGLVTGANCDVVISAGHAAFYWQSVPRKGWRKGELRARGRFRFSPEPHSVDNWQPMSLVSSGFARQAGVGKDEHDWSIFRLPAPALSDCKNIPLPAAVMSCKGDLLMPGFHFDRPDTKLLVQGCAVKDTTGKGVIVHDCDSKDGSSGAPLFCRVGRTLSLLAINISGLTRRDYYDAGVYGKSGLRFNDRQHKNFALFVGGEFFRALKRELKASVERQASRLSR